MPRFALPTSLVAIGALAAAASADPGPRLPPEPVGAPLTVLASGDPTIAAVGASLSQQLADSSVNVRSDPLAATPLSRVRPGDLPRLAAAQVRRFDPDVTVVVQGASEGGPMRLRERRSVSCCGRPWQAEYTRRVRRTMSAYTRGTANRVYWILLPRSPRLLSRVDPGGVPERVYPAVNAATKVAARGLRAGVRLIHLDEVFVARGRAREALGGAGRPQRARAGPLRLSAEGAWVAATLVVARMRADGLLVRG